MIGSPDNEGGDDRISLENFTERLGFYPNDSLFVSFLPSGSGLSHLQNIQRSAGDPVTQLQLLLSRHKSMGPDVSDLGIVGVALAGWL